MNQRLSIRCAYCKNIKKTNADHAVQSEKEEKYSGKCLHEAKCTELQEQGRQTPKQFMTLSGGQSQRFVVILRDFIGNGCKNNEPNFWGAE